MTLISQAISGQNVLDVRGALRAGIARLADASVPSAAFCAELLVMHVLGHDRTWLYAHPEGAITGEQRVMYETLLTARIAGTPTQYLTGKQEFWGLEFEVTPDVLIPRPETEHLIEVTLARLNRRRSDELLVADVGTGFGCIAVALARELPQARLVATDSSAAALEVAMRNALRHGVRDRIEFSETNLLASYLALRPETRRRFDAIVSNPPYVGHEEAAELPREVREHEPAQALFSGVRGMDTYPVLIAQAEQLLRDGGLLVLELGHQAANMVRSLLNTPPWCEVTSAHDLAGIERVISAQRTRSGI